MRHYDSMPEHALLSGRPFRQADAKAAGLSRRQLQGRRFRRLYRDVYVDASVPDSLALRCDGALLVLPKDVAFSHHTAAALRRLPVPDEPTVHVVVRHGKRTDIGGIRAHQGFRDEDVRHVEGRPLTSVERTFLDLAPMLGHVDLVILGDAALNRACTTEQALTEAVEQAGARRGLRRAREVLPMLEPPAESPMETRLRLVLVFGGLPRPVANLAVFDEYGQWVGRPDLQYPAQRIAIQYEGKHHRRETRQYESDIMGDEVLSNLGWVIIKITAADVFVRPQVTVERVRRHLIERAAST